MEPEQIVEILKYAFLIILAVIFGLVIVYVVLWLKNRNAKEKEVVSTEEKPNKKTSTSTGLGMDKQSIFNFMEFDTVDDNMIIQKNGTKFLMVIECQGVNYDLMSGVEKASVEEGFVQFLNTLRNPIQIYIQTRSVNLESSLSTYKEKVRKIEDKLNKMRMQYYEMQDSGDYSQEQLDKAFFELTKQSNLYEYGRDIINDTERMSLNKNVLNKKYYIIVPYYASELQGSDLDKEEIKNMAFSEIYTRAQSLVGSIAACGVRGKILRTNELIELLYMAYNRDEAEVFGLDKAIQAGYNEMNSTAADVLDKKMKEIDKYIQEKAMETARDAVNQVTREKEKRVRQKEQSVDSMILQMAEAILKENEKYIGTDVMEESIEKVSGAKRAKATKEEKGGEKNGKKVSTTRQKRATRTTRK